MTEVYDVGTKILIDNGDKDNPQEGTILQVIIGQNHAIGYDVAYWTNGSYNRTTFVSSLVQRKMGEKSPIKIGFQQ